MDSIVTYIEREQRTFAESPFNPVDSLVFSSLCYFNFDTASPLEQFAGANVTLDAHTEQRVLIADILALCDHTQLTSGSWLKDADETTQFIAALRASRRYRDVTIAFFANEMADAVDKQFSASTFFFYGKHSEVAYVAFRGTDGTLTGWKEDFNMAFQYPVPAQVTAADYLARVAALWKDVPIVLTGHSKGGNLAVYAAMNASDEVKDRVERIYSLDGPGFPESVVNSFEYASVSDRIVKIVPDSSVVGMVLETPERCIVVKSDVEGIMQHFVFSWQMHGGEFDKVEDVANSSVTFNKALNGWLSNLSKEQRERAVDALFAVLEASGAGSISAMMAAGPKVIPEMLGTYVGLSVEDRRNLNQALGIMLQAALARNPKVRRR